MEETKKWWQSKIINMCLALFAGALSYFGVSYQIISETDLDAAATVYPEIERSIELIIAGQWLAGLVAAGSALVIYFRAKKTTKIISLSSTGINRKAA